MIESTELANERGYLWPPIADALDTYIRRKASGAEGYELTWRLIHVWEAIAVTLSAAATTRVRDVEPSGPLFRRCREHYHGRTWNSITQSFNRSQGALDGSATKRIDVLWEFSSQDAPGTAFLSALKTFLLAQTIDLRSFAVAWARICDVPAEARQSSPFTVREAMRHINTFRNRFAHVPFPYDVMDDVARELEVVTEGLFATEPRPCQVLPTSEALESPLCGAVVWRERAMRGNSNFRFNYSSSAPCSFCYPAIAKKSTAPEIWDGEPFLFVDSMLRPYVLTRLRSEASGAWEFTRFRAEANSVLTLEQPRWLGSLPEPTQGEYMTQQDRDEKAEELSIAAENVTAAGDLPAAETSTTPTTFEEALRFIRNEDYGPAIAFLARLVDVRPEYHIGWLRLGHAQREFAMRKRVLEPDSAVRLFSDAIHSLTQAAGHIDDGRRAQALYERSKAYYHRGRFIKAPDDLTAALVDAVEAYKLSPDTPYESWIEFLKKHVGEHPAVIGLLSNEALRLSGMPGPPAPRPASTEGQVVSLVEPAA